MLIIYFGDQTVHLLFFELRISKVEMYPERRDWLRNKNI